MSCSRLNLVATGLLFFVSVLVAEEDPVATVLNFDETEYKKWESVRTRIETRCSKSNAWGFARGFARPVAVQTPTERIRLPKKSFRAYKAAQSDIPILIEVATHFPEVDTVTFGFDASVKKIPIDLLTALQKMPQLKSVAVHFATGLAWDEGPIEAIVALEDLESLRLVGEFPVEHFTSIRKLQNLHTVAIAGNYSARIFETLAELPNLTTLTLGAGGEISIEKPRPETIKAIAKFEGRPMSLRFDRGVFQVDVVREFIKLRSTKRLTINTKLRDAKLEDFDGIETIPDLEHLDVRVLNDLALNQQLNKRLAARKRRAAAVGRRASRKIRMAKEHPQQPPLISSPTVTPQQVDVWMSRMASEGRQFDPSKLLTYGDVGLKAMLHRVFPEITAKQEPVVDDLQIIRDLVERLDSDKFKVRELAMKELIVKGKPHAAFLEQVMQSSSSAEVQARCRSIFVAWQGESAKAKGNPVLSAKFVVGWRRYLDRLTEYSSDKLLVESIVKAMNARVDLTNRAKLLGGCFTPVTKCIDDALYEELATLCDHEDTAVPIFVLKQLGGRAGNGYVTPVHKAAIVSNRKELVKVGFSSMPSPVWDRSFKPFLQNHYRNLFRDPSKSKFANDPEFLRLQAFSAAREHNIEGARDYLIAQIDSEDTMHAVRSISMLCDTAYEQRPLDKKLRQASERLLAADESERRIAGIQILWTYRASNETYEALLKAVEDEDEKVWQHATNALLQHQAWQKRHPTQIDIVARLSQRAEKVVDDQLQSRLQTIIEILQKPDKARRRRNSKGARWVRRPH